MTQGQPILELDLAYLNANARSMISPVVVSNMEEFGALTATANTTVVAGQSRLLDLTGK